MTTLAVQFNRVEKRYPHFKLADIQFDLPEGHIMGFIGPNGAGKSTTMRILMGLVHQDRGEVKVLGKSMPSELTQVLADEERTILFSSHNTRDVEQLSDQIAFIDRGRIIDSKDKETFLDRWRRLRLEVPKETDLPVLPGVVNVKKSGRLAVVTTNEYDPKMTNAIQEAGATVQGVENMTLEEIFVANVQRSRGGDEA